MEAATDVPYPVFSLTMNRVDLATGFPQIIEELRVGGGEVRRDRSRAENPFEAAAGNVERDRVPDKERNALPLRHRSRNEGDGGMVGTQHRHDFILRDQPQRLVLADLRVALMVHIDELDFCATEIGEPRGRGERKTLQLGMRGIDDLCSKLDRILGGRAGAGGVAGEWIDDPDLDRIGARAGSAVVAASHAAAKMQNAFMGSSRFASSIAMPLFALILAGGG